MKTKLIALIENWFPVYKVILYVIAFVLSLAIGLGAGTGAVWVYHRYGTPAKITVCIASFFIANVLGWILGRAITRLVIQKKGTKCNHS